MLIKILIGVSCFLLGVVATIIACCSYNLGTLHVKKATDSEKDNYLMEFYDLEDVRNHKIAILTIKHDS